MLLLTNTGQIRFSPYIHRPSVTNAHALMYSALQAPLINSLSTGLG